MRRFRIGIWRAAALIAAGAVTPVTSAVYAAGPHEDFQVWPSGFVRVPLGHGFLGSVEAIDRVVEDSSREGQVELRFQIGHAIGRDVTLWAGYIHYTTFGGAGRDTQEEQALEQLDWKAGSIGPVRVALRTRLEQRFISNDSGVNWRLRQQLRLELPVGAHGSALVLWGEPFFALNHTRVVNTDIEQVRAFAGVTVPLNRHLSFETGYLMQYLHRRTGDLVNHALPLQFTLKL